MTDLFTTRLQEALALAGRGQVDAAIAAADKAAALNPGHAVPFTLRTMLVLRRRFGPPPLPRLPGAQPPISMRALGLQGRFGNQLMQYAFLRLYAGQHGLCAQAPDWIGRDLFGCNDPIISQPLPSLDESQADLFGSLNGQGPVHAGRDLSGYFCGETAQWGNRRDAFRALFTLRPPVAAALQPALDAIAARGRTLVAVHLRRGDFGQGQFWIAPSDWYRAWLEALWPTLEAPVLYIASDDPLTVRDFAAYDPLDARQLPAGDLDFLLDHQVLRRADHLGISNSSFSFTAAMLNGGAHFVRPDPVAQALVPFDPWNAPVLLPPA